MWGIECPPDVLGSEIAAEHLTDPSQDAQVSSEAILPPFESRIDNVLPHGHAGSLLGDAVEMHLASQKDFIAHDGSGCIDLVVQLVGGGDF